MKSTCIECHTGDSVFIYSIILLVPFHTALFPKDPLYLLLRAARTVSIIVMIESVVDVF